MINHRDIDVLSRRHKRLYGLYFSCLTYYLAQKVMVDSFDGHLHLPAPWLPLYIH